MESLFYLLLLLGALVLFGLQYLLCARAKRRWVRALPLSAPALLCAAALSVLYSPTGGGFLDLRPLVCFLILCHAALCLAAIGLAWLVWWLRHRRR